MWAGSKGGRAKQRGTQQSGVAREVACRIGVSGGIFRRKKHKGLSEAGKKERESYALGGQINEMLSDSTSNCRRPTLIGG
ncbi:hypothetical protein CDAR_237921 [Caerostris darwini]|uniref:Histone H4 n=1 Tax=Caerostris darwini TaxID=1538125 RepID=A0AAV4S582_9ARAC|nr:hypothetical protein CDAR_237921 [Caerostris darwini]